MGEDGLKNDTQRAVKLLDEIIVLFRCDLDYNCTREALAMIAAERAKDKSFPITLGLAMKMRQLGYDV